MKFSIRAILAAAVGGAVFGFGISHFSRHSLDPYSKANEDLALPGTPIANEPIVSIAAPDADETNETAKAARPKQSAKAGPKTAASPKTAANLVKELEAIRKQPAERRNQRREAELLDQWIEMDPAGASAWAAELFATGGDEQILRKAMQVYARRDPRAAAVWASSLPSPLVRDSALREVFETWAARDPHRAAEMVSLLPIGTAQSTAATVVGKHFSRVDFEEALAWMGSLAAPAQGAAFQSIMRTQWASSGTTNPGGAMPWLLAQSSISFREQGLRFIASEWAKRDPLSALSYGAFINQRSDRNQFVETALRTYTQTNPRDAALWLANQPSSPETERLMNQVMTAWTAFAPEESARWAGSLQNPSLRNKSLTSVAESWAKVDPEGLVEWIGRLDDNGTRDAVIDGATRAWMRNDPANAAQWAAGIVDRGKRDYSLTQIVREWKNHDPGAALAFVRTTPVLDEDLRKRLLK